MSTKKIALVTGGSRGLGRDMAIQIAKKGLDVILTYNGNQQKANETVAAIQSMGQKAVALQLSVNETKSFGDFAGALRKTLQRDFNTHTFDYLVNNAGIGINAPFTETTEEQFDSLVNIQFKGTFFLTQALLPLMKDGGGIINISTGLTRFALPGFSAYAAAKGAVEVLTRYQAKELGVRGIKVNVVAPGAIETDFGDGVVRDNKEINDRIASIIALGRVGLPDDIGGVVAFLCTEDAKWVNAQRIEVSGGQLI